MVDGSLVVIQAHDALAQGAEGLVNDLDRAAELGVHHEIHSVEAGLACKLIALVSLDIYS